MIKITYSSILLLFMSSSISWGQEPINFDEIYEITQLSTTEHTIHGSVINDGFGNPQICPFGDPSCGFGFGGGLQILSKDKKLIQKLKIQCTEKDCTVTGTIFPSGFSPDFIFSIIEITSYTVGIEPNSKYVQNFLFNTLNGTPVFYEGNIEWGTNYDEIFGVSKPYETINFDVSNLSENEKFEILELHNNCSKVKVTGFYKVGYSDGIIVNEFKCLD